MHIVKTMFRLLVKGNGSTCTITRGWSSSCFQNTRKSEINYKAGNLQKIAILSEVNRVLSTNNLIAVVHYNDLDAQEWRNIRLKLNENNIKVKVFPSKIVMRALSTTRYQKMATLFHGCTAMISETEGAPSTVDRLLQLVQKEDKLELLGGLIDQQLLPCKRLQNYARIFSVDILRQEMVNILNQLQCNLEHTLKCPSKQLSVSLQIQSPEV